MPNKYERFVAYLDLQEKIGGEKPPCVNCGGEESIIRFDHCRSTNSECEAFRQYVNTGKFNEKKIGVKIRGANYGVKV